MIKIDSEKIPECRLEPRLTWDLTPTQLNQEKLKQKQESRWRYRRENRIRDPWGWLTGTRKKSNRDTSIENGIELHKIEEIVAPLNLKNNESLLARSDRVTTDKSVSRKRVKKKKKQKTASHDESATSSDEDSDVTRQRFKDSNESKFRQFDSSFTEVDTHPIEALWICSASLISTEGGRGEARPLEIPPDYDQELELVAIHDLELNIVPDLDKDLDQEVEKYLSEVDKRLSVTCCHLPDKNVSFENAKRWKCKIA